MSRAEMLQNQGGDRSGGKATFSGGQGLQDWVGSGKCVRGTAVGSETGP